MSPELPELPQTYLSSTLVDDAEQTRDLIRYLWANSARHQRRDPYFLRLLMQLAWTNESGKKRRGRKTTRVWRDENVADYLDVPGAAETIVIERIVEEFELEKEKIIGLLRPHTGIAHFYNAFRPAVYTFVRKHSEEVNNAFRRAASQQDTKTKIRKIFALLFEDDFVWTFENGVKKTIPRVSALTPVIACLDPALRFPIITSKTRPLLKELGHVSNEEGAMELYRRMEAMGKNSLELDVYAVLFNDRVAERRRRKRMEKHGQYRRP